MTVLPTDEPDTIPHRAEEMTATLAGPPEKRPTRAFAMSIKNCEMPVRSRKAPKMIKTMMNFEQTCTGVFSSPPPCTL